MNIAIKIVAPNHVVSPYTTHHTKKFIHQQIRELKKNVFYFNFVTLNFKTSI